MENFTSSDLMLANSINTIFLLFSGMNILMMQAGFLALEAGGSRAKSTKTLLYKNFIDIGVCALCFFSVGWGIYLGNSPFASGEGATFYQHPVSQYSYLFQQFSFAVVVATIVSSSVNPRMRIEACVLLSAEITSVTYPIVAHWGWNEYGWMEEFGFLDFAGSGIVHLFGGACSLVVLATCGPRAGRFAHPKAARDARVDFDLNSPQSSIFGVLTKRWSCRRCGLYSVRKLPGGSNPALMVVGTLLLWLGWFSFNAGSARNIVLHPDEASRAAINSLLSSGAAVVTAMLFVVISKSRYDLEDACNSVLSGMVAITASSGFVEPWAAIVVGSLSFVVYKGSSFVVVRVLGVDDPLQAVSVHGSNGLLGLTWLGLTHPKAGLFMNGDFHFLGVQLLAGLAITGFGIITTAVVVLPLRWVKFLTYSNEEQLVGIDFLHFVDEGQDVDMETGDNNSGYEHSEDGSEDASEHRHPMIEDELNIMRPDTSDSGYRVPSFSRFEGGRTAEDEMKRVMGDYRIRRRFRAFLAVMHREESVDFWDAVFRWKQIKSRSRRIAEAKRILSTFCLEEGQRQVNLSSSTLQTLKTACDDEKQLLDSTLFDKAISEVYGDLKVAFLEFVEKTPQYWL